MLENRLPSQFTLLSRLVTRKRTKEISVLSVVLQNIITVIIAVLQHLDGSFWCFGQGL